MDLSHTHSTTSGPVYTQTTPKVGVFLKSFERHPRASAFFSNYGNLIKGLTGIAFVTHFLKIRSAIDAQEAATASNTLAASKKFFSIRHAGVAGLAWSVVWFGVLGATTLADETVHRRIDPVAIQRQQKVPWNVELTAADKEEI